MWIRYIAAVCLSIAVVASLPAADEMPPFTASSNGFSASERGDPENLNPHKKGSDAHDWWGNGWREAKGGRGKAKAKAKAVAADVKIEGRDAATPGQLVVLKGIQPAGESVSSVWVYDKEYGFDTLQCAREKSLAFATGKPGRYVFWLVVWDGKTHTVAKHAVTVGGVVPINTPPEVAPGGNLASLAEKWAVGYAARAMALKDFPTSAALVAEWKARSGKVRGSPDLKAAGLVVRSGFEAAMGSRKELSRYVPWIKDFRLPLNEDLGKWIEKGLIKTPADLDLVIQAIVRAMSPDKKTGKWTKSGFGSLPVHPPPPPTDEADRVPTHRDSYLRDDLIPPG